jgi:D-aminoacyl-tRNA deacylase
MKAVLQRVNNASVVADGVLTGSIEQGILVLLGIHSSDTEASIQWMVKKIVQMRIFNDEAGLMNKSVADIDGEILLISQFTLYGDAKKGNRPSFIEAARPEVAIPIYEKVKAELALALGKPIPAGVFGADMKVSLCNDGPVTIVLESPNT